VNTCLRILTVPILILFTAFGSKASSEENTWHVAIELPGTTFISLEPIWLDITLTNVSADTQRTAGLDGPNHRGFGIFLYDSRGDSVRHTGPQINFGGGPGRLLLEPGEQDYGSFDLTELFFSHEAKSGYSVGFWRFHYIPRGEYTVRAWYHGAVSNQLTFEIVEPHGEEVKALRLMEDALRAWTPDGREPMALLYRQVVERYPRSAFAEASYYLSVLYSHWAEQKEGTWDKNILYRRMLEHCPNSGRSGSWIVALTHDKEDNERLAVINELLEKHPNTRCYKYAEQLKKRILKGTLGY